MFNSLLARAREARAAELEEEGLEGGFTLIELMVVLLIIAILLAIAIPTFLGVTGSAKDRSAQSQLTNVLTETVATYQNTQAYPATGGATAPNYSVGDPQFGWVDGTTNAGPCTTAATKCVSVVPVDVAGAADLQGVILAVMSSTGTCWAVVNTQTNPPQPYAAFVPADAAQFTAAAGNAPTAGTFYAKANNATGGPPSAGSCWAGNFLTGKKWGNDYGHAGANVM